MALDDIARGENEVVGSRGIGEESLESVIIRLANGIKLVVMASCAAKGKTSKNRANGIGDVV